MSRPVLEVADIFRDHGAAWRRANVGHVSLDQMKVMSAIERCRTAALGGHVARCEDCPHTVIAYNSCRNRHCPKCQGAAANEWLAAREADLLPVPYFHVEVRHRKQIGLARCKPFVSGGALALRTMPITTAVVGDDCVGAVFAARHVAAEGGRAA